jgi:hypothetical protein
MNSLSIDRVDSRQNHDGGKSAKGKIKLGKFFIDGRDFLHKELIALKRKS